jgi:glycerate-2-kinase
MALAFAIRARNHPVGLMTLATDGKDGCSPATGALVDGATARAGLARGGDPWRAMGTNDSYTFLRLARAIIASGPTGTNVADIAVVILNP